VIKEYLGRGDRAVAAADEDAARRAVRAARRQAEQERRRLDLALGERLVGIGTEANALVEAALLAAGYHRPQRKPWRKRRSGRTGDDNAAREGCVR
jgi:hypothetical protein